MMLMMMMMYVDQGKGVVYRLIMTHVSKTFRNGPRAQFYLPPARLSTNVHPAFTPQTDGATPDDVADI